MISVKGIRNVSRQVISFEMSCENRDCIYLVQKRAVFEFTLKQSIMLSRRDSCINDSRRSNSILCNTINDGIPFFTQTKKDILFFKFDPKMKYFFLNDARVIKKYDRNTKQLVRVFEGHTKKVRSVLFSEDFQLLFRYSLILSFH